MVKPIRPDEVADQKKKYIPEGVLESFNEAISKNYSNGWATVLQDEVIDIITQKTGYSRTFIFENKWLDVEDIYRAEGWKVTYDKPGYNESYKASFEFRKK